MTIIGMVGCSAAIVAAMVSISMGDAAEGCFWLLFAILVRMPEREG